MAGVFVSIHKAHSREMHTLSPWYYTSPFDRACAPLFQTRDRYVLEYVTTADAAEVIAAPCLDFYCKRI